MLFYGPQLNMKSKTPPFVNLRQPVTDIEAAMQCTILTLQASGSGKGKNLSPTYMGQACKWAAQVAGNILVDKLTITLSFEKKRL